MQLVKLITPKRINALQGFFLALAILFSSFILPAFSQDNSPYSRYGIGDLVPPTHMIGRAMGGISAGYSDFLSINFNNPASYSGFQTVIEPRTKKLMSGRAMLDIGLNFENRTLNEPSTGKSFTASNALFSYVQVGMPIKRNWGISFGLRPFSRISYKMFQDTRMIIDPNTGLPIDSAINRFEGDGGLYLVSAGTGFSLFQREKKNNMEEKLSFGINAGYLFGKKDYSSKRSIVNDTVDYYQANFETKTSIGDLFLNAGVQYRVPLNADKLIALTVGAYGNLKQNLNAFQDRIAETFIFDDNLGEVRLDSVSDVKDVRGKLVYPGSFTLGFVTEKYPEAKKAGWLLGMDLSFQNWDKYSFYGQKDSVQNNWQLRIGGQLRPASKKNYFSNVAYRVGFFAGPDYIKVGQKMNQMGFSFGLGLPVANYRSAYTSANQATLINLALEYGKRGNNDNILSENTFRLSVGFSLSDFWFLKRKYD